MFERFLQNFPQTYLPSKTETSNHFDLANLFEQARLSKQFLSEFEGSTFSNGLYRIHRLAEIEKWTQIVETIFPNFKGFIKCFSYDWMGRQFAIDFSRYLSNEALILMFDIGANQVFKIPRSFCDFHNFEIVDYSNDALNSYFFEEWKTVTNNTKIDPDRCVGYKVPLFLNGEDTVENLKEVDMQVYWELLGQFIGTHRLKKIE